MSDDIPAQSQHSEESPVPPQDVKPEAETQQDTKPEEDLLSVKVTDNQTEVFFRVKRSTPVRRIIDGFCKRTGKDQKSLRFMFDGERINGDDTPQSLGMDDGDAIEALNQQTGGQ